VLVHHAIDDHVRLVAGVVTGVTTLAGGNDVAVRLTTGGGREIIHPSRLTVHHDPIEYDGHCWRCVTNDPPTTAPAKRRRA
jgi:hypothetical protein